MSNTEIMLFSLMILFAALAVSTTSVAYRKGFADGKRRTMPQGGSATGRIIPPQGGSGTAPPQGRPISRPIIVKKEMPNRS